MLGSTIRKRSVVGRFCSQQLSFATEKAMEKNLLVADQAFHQIIPQCEARLDFLYDVLFNSVLWLSRPSIKELIRLIAQKESIFSSWWVTGRDRCLVSNDGLAKLTAKDEPQYQNYSNTKSRRILSKINPVEQLHQGAVNTYSIIICLILEQRTPFFLMSMLNASISVAHFPAWYLVPL